MNSLLFGSVSALIAYILWGILPLYWKPLNHIDPLTILAYRIMFSFVVAWITLLVLHIRRKSAFRGLKKYIPLSVLAACLLGVNWYVFIWAVLKGYTLEASLGYFLNPLVNLLLGVVFLQERPGKMRCIALALSVVAVSILTISHGQLPVISLTLAGTFGLYGYIKKRAKVSAVLGLGLETLWLLIPAVYILWGLSGIEVLIHGDAKQQALLLFAGPVTLAPLLFFATAAQRIPLYILGFLQYIAPSLMFIIALLVFGEQTNPAEMLAFGIIWSALLLFSYTIVNERLRNRE